jgi:hypothetical protein
MQGRNASGPGGKGERDGRHTDRADQLPTDGKLCSRMLAGQPVRLASGGAGDRPAARDAAITACVQTWRGEQIMIHQHRTVPLGGEQAEIRSCWMCGIRLPVDQMLADGTSACLDLRWYCRDTFGCTKRWTSRSATLVAIRQATAETSKAPGKSVAIRPATTAETSKAPGKSVAIRQATAETSKAPGKQAVSADVAQPVPA